MSSTVMPEKNETEQIEEQFVIKQHQNRQKKHISVRDFFNSPYLFILLPLLIGGFYLVNHPQYIIMGVNNPYAVAFVLSIPVCVFVIKLVINFFSLIERWIKLQFEKARQSKQGYFFELVIVVFMFVSVCEAGPFFNDIQHNILNGSLGYITVLAFDLIAVVCIDARRKELAKGGTKAAIYLTGVIICAAVSMVANLYSALLNFQAPIDPTFPSLLKSAAPYIGIMFPIMIVFLAFSRDIEVQVDDAETYRKQQLKRVDFLTVRREILEKITSEMERIDLLRKREFFLKSWFFTNKKLHFVIDVVTERAREATSAEIATLKQELLRQEQVIDEQVQFIQRLSSEMQQLSTTLTIQRETASLQMAEIVQLRQEIDRAHSDFAATIEQQVAAKLQALHVDTSGDTQQQISTARPATKQPPQTENNWAGISEEVVKQEQERIATVKRAKADIPAYYGLTDAEKQLLTNAYPKLEDWFQRMPASVTISEIVDVTALRQIRITNALTSKKIKPAKGRNRVQTESFLRWLIQDIRRAKKRTQRPARTLNVTSFSGNFLLDDKPGEQDEQGNEPEVVSEIPSIAQLNQPYQGPRTEELEVMYLPEKAIYVDKKGDKL